MSKNMKKMISRMVSHRSFPYVMAFLMPFIICVVICIGNGVYPFGDNCILHIDMYHQYCPFFTEFLHKLRTGGSLQYSWNLGLGSDFVSLYAYYVIEFMTKLVLAKIALCGLTFFLFLKYHFHLIGKDSKLHKNQVIPALVFSTAYALSGFVAAYSWDIMWMDCILLFPLIMVGLEKLVREQKPGDTCIVGVCKLLHFHHDLHLSGVLFYSSLFYAERRKTESIFTVRMVFPAGRVCLDGTAIAGDRRAFCFRVC